MEIHGSTVLVLGGAGLVGGAVARRIVGRRPDRLVLASLHREEAERAVAALAAETAGDDVALEAAWGDVFLPASLKDRSRSEIVGDPDARGRMLDDLYGELTPEVFERSSLGRLLLDVRPDVVVDCVNTAGALAYQNVFGSAERLRDAAARGEVDPAAAERHLGTLYLPKLIRHVQVALEGMKRVETEMYVKIGTSGTGGMGLNIPFTHSEERPSRMLLAKAGLAGAHTLLLYLMARTPGAPAVKEVKPTAAISWKSIEFGPIRRGGRPLELVDATEPLEVGEAFDDPDRGHRRLGRPLEGVYLDAGENGLFSSSEFEALTALGLMEYVTPEEIAEAVLREIRGHPTGLDTVAALDAASMGPTYRAGVLRSTALRHMEELERETGCRPVAYEMLGPPRLSKLLFEAAILRRLHGDLETCAGLAPDRTARRALELVRSDDDLRQRIVSIGLPILLPDGASVLRGAEVKVPPEGDGDRVGDRVADRGWVDLRPANWTRWRERTRGLAEELRGRPGVEAGSRGDHEYGDETGAVRPGRLAAWILRYEDEGERIKR